MDKCGDMAEFVCAGEDKTRSLEQSIIDIATFVSTLCLL